MINPLEFGILLLRQYWGLVTKKEGKMSQISLLISIIIFYVIIVAMPSFSPKRKNFEEASVRDDSEEPKIRITAHLCL